MGNSIRVRQDVGREADRARSGAYNIKAYPEQHLVSGLTVRICSGVADSAGSNGRGQQDLGQSNLTDTLVDLGHSG
jgi:hypothetical protein